MIILWWNVEPVLLWLKQDLEVAAYATLYIRWLSPSLPGTR